MKPLIPPGIIVSGGASDWTKSLKVSDEDNRVSGVQTIITEDMKPNTMDPVSVHIQEARRQRQMVMDIASRGVKDIMLALCWLETQGTDSREKQD